MGGGASTTLATADALGVALDDAYVYWTNYHARKVYRRAKNSGPDSELATGLRPNGLVVADGYVYWSDSDTLTVNRVPVGGGANEVLATIPGGGYLQRIALDADTVFVVNENGTVYSVPRTGGVPTELISGLTSPIFIEVDDHYAYVPAGSSIWAIPKNGDPAFELITGQATPRDIHLQDGYLYWLNSGTGSVMRY